MAMQLTIPEDLQALIEKRIAIGAFDSAMDVVRHALEAQDYGEEWTDEERLEIVDHIEEGYQQAERGELFDEDEVKLHLKQFKERWLNERQLR